MGMRLKTVDFRTSAEAFGHLESFTNLEKAPNLTAREYRLDRMYALLPLFGNPQNAFKSIHVAGSKGKGSTAAFIAGILAANGIKTGLYSSPHVETYKERISMAGTFFDETLYTATASMMMSVIEAESGGENLPGGLPTTFELLTLLSFLIFRESGCEWAVFETGLGGRLDATNVIIPEASVLTLIELEHTEYLGDTIEKIALEKAGIIKKGVPVFSGDQHPEAESVFRQTAASKCSDIFFPDDLVTNLTSVKTESGPWAQEALLRLKTGEEISFKLKQAGFYQAKNAAMAVSVLAHLKRKKETGISDINLALGIPSTALPGRMEVFAPAGSPKVVLDGAHTPKSAILSAQAFFETTGEAGGTLLFGAVDGKDTHGMAEVLSALFNRVVISTPGTFKKSDPDEVFRIFSSTGISAELLKDPSDALDRALSYGKPVFVTGSFYMVSEIRALLT
ncbi:MAG: bifunctional folylpolyglutamate synthase/dihydrofolate synthase [Spirochaetales bacterium]|nr:bifunctional folylpolyglutamate synthase/dihydrofolate synthase [Spirochaetales bacterium]